MPKPSSKKDLAAALLQKLEEWQKQGMTAEQAVEKLSIKQYDFLVDYGIDMDKFVLTPEQIKAVHIVKKRERSTSPNGYNKIYPQDKINLYETICQFLETQGFSLEKPTKPNYRDLILSKDGKTYKIVLSVPRS